MAALNGGFSQPINPFDTSNGGAVPGPFAIARAQARQQNTLNTVSQQFAQLFGAEPPPELLQFAQQIAQNQGTPRDIAANTGLTFNDQVNILDQQLNQGLQQGISVVDLLANLFQRQSVRDTRSGDATRRAQNVFKQAMVVRPPEAPPKRRGGGESEYMSALGYSEDGLDWMDYDV